MNAPHLILGKILAQAYDTAAYKIAADDLLAAHKVDILFHALGAGVVMQDDKRINVLMVETKAGRQAVRANIFIDCSGDGDLAAWAGAPFEVGDNAGSMLYPSMMFRLNGIDPEKAGEAWRTIPALMEKAEAAGTHQFPRKAAIVRPQRSQIEWRVNFTQLAREDGARGQRARARRSHARRDRRAAVRRSRRSNSCARCPASRNPTSSICRRSSASAKRDAWSAAICCPARTCSAAPRSRIPSASMAGRWNPMSPGDVIFKFPPIPGSRGFNELPYRMLVPEGVDNLLMAGRCASMTHDGQSAARVSGACFAMGEAVGAAAALALSGNTIPRDIAVEKLQQALKEQGAFIGRDQAVPAGL